MRRISLAFALVGAVAVTGCGGNVSPNSGGGKGVGDGTFKITIQNGQGQVRDPVSLKLPLELLGGKVFTDDGKIDCGEGVTTQKCETTYPLGTSVTIKSTPGSGNALLTWAGDCSGWDTCTFTGNADKYVVAEFGPAGTWTAHPSWAAGKVHGPLYFNQATNGYVCANCHGGTALAGGGFAPSCGACHTNPAAFAAVGHFDPANPAWGNHTTGWSQDCQRCHTDQGFRDFMGELAAPGEATPSKDYLTTSKSTNPLPTPPNAAATVDSYNFGPLKCSTCHNDVIDPAKGTMERKVRFPSTKIVDADAATAICAQCHQARESSSTIETKIAAKGLTVDQAGTAFNFLNPHYLGAAATLYGSAAAGWVQYGANVYTGQNKHGGVGSCTYCHDAHNGQLPADGGVVANKCGRCHFDEITGQPVDTLAALEESRQFGFEGDIDGDGTIEPVKVEIDGLAAKVYELMQSYAVEVLAAPITYTDTYPYYMNASSTQYNTFSPRLMRAAVNYKWYKADPGAWAHNPRYAIEVLFDTAWDLNAGLKTVSKQQDLSALRRSFAGHFGSAGFAQEPYAQFLYHPAAGSAYGTPGTGFTGSTCGQCHGGQGGYEAYLSGVPVPVRTSSDCIGAAPCAVAAGGQPDPILTPGTFLTYSNRVTGMQCTTCHQPLAADGKFTRMRASTDMFIPPQKGAVGTNGVVKFAAADLPPSFSMCGTCHTGLENMASVDTKIATMADPALFTATFVNGHYYGAAGIILGTDAKVLYEYAGKTYPGKPVNWSTGASGPHGSPHGARCVGCHDPQQSAHSFEINEATTVPNGLEKVYPTTVWAQNTRTCDACHAGQYALAPTKAKLQTLGADLLAAMKAYALANNAGLAICYSPSQYPYFLKDTDGNGVCNGTELDRLNGYKFNAKLLKAGYNYQWFVKDPGAAEHNYAYIGSVLFDAIEDLGGTTTITRP